LTVFATEVLRLVLHFVLKNQLISSCVQAIQGQEGTTVTGSPFNEHVNHHVITPQDAQDDCNSLWSHDTFTDIAWLLVATLLGMFFAAINFAYYRQLMDPSSMRTMAPSNAFQMNATRNAYGYNAGGIPGYNPYQTQTYGDYVPPYGYDASKPPGYTSGGYDRSSGDEKIGYSAPAPPAANDDPFADSNRAEGGYLPPAGPPPPGLGSSNHDRDEGFDPVAVQLALRASETDQKGGEPVAGAGPSTR